MPHLESARLLAIRSVECCCFASGVVEDKTGGVFWRDPWQQLKLYKPRSLFVAGVQNPDVLSCHSSDPRDLEQVPIYFSDSWTNACVPSSTPALLVMYTGGKERTP